MGEDTIYTFGCSDYQIDYGAKKSVNGVNVYLDINNKRILSHNTIELIDEIEIKDRMERIALVVGEIFSLSSLNINHGVFKIELDTQTLIAKVFRLSPEHLMNKYKIN